MKPSEIPKPVIRKAVGQGFSLFAKIGEHVSQSRGDGVRPNYVQMGEGERRGAQGKGDDHFPYSPSTIERVFALLKNRALSLNKCSVKNLR